MWRLRKQVQHHRTDQFVSSLDQQPGISAKRSRVTTHQHDDDRLRPRNRLDSLAPEPFAGRVGNDTYPAAFEKLTRRTPTVNVLTNHVSVRVRSQIDHRIIGRRFAGLHGYDAAEPSPDRCSEEPHASVQIQQKVALIGHSALNELNQTLCAVGPRLKERVGRDHKGCPTDGLLEQGLIFVGLRFGSHLSVEFIQTDHDDVNIGCQGFEIGEYDVAPRRFDDNQHLLTCRAISDGDLARVGEATVGDETLDHRMRHLTRRNRHDPAASRCPKTGLTVDHRNPDTGPVAPHLQWWSGDDSFGGIANPARPAESIGNHRYLQWRLRLVRYMLPPASAASADHVRAGRNSSRRTWFDDLDNVAPGKVSPIIVELDQEKFPRKATLNEDNFSFLGATDGITSNGYRMRSKPYW